MLTPLTPRHSEESEQPPTDDCANDSKQNVDDDALSSAVDDPAGNETGNESEKDPRKQRHDALHPLSESRMANKRRASLLVLSLLVNQEGFGAAPNVRRPRSEPVAATVRRRTERTCRGHILHSSRASAPKAARTIPPSERGYRPIQYLRTAPHTGRTRHSVDCAGAPRVSHQQSR